MLSRKVLIDFIMLVTINLQPFDGKISMDHYKFNLCKYTDLYRQQFFGNYNDTFEGYSGKVFHTTCVDGEEGEFDSYNYIENCKNIVSQAGFTYRCTSRYKLRYI